MNPNPALRQLLDVIDSHTIAIGKDEVQRAFKDGNAEELATWVQEYLNPETLLSREEEAL